MGGFDAMECVVVTTADVEVATAGRRVRGTCGLGLYPQRHQQYQDWSLTCLLYTSPSPRDLSTSRMPSSA